MKSSAAKMGVLDLQGGVQEHLDHLQRIGVPARRVKRAEDFEALAGLIIPGGETTCLRRLLQIFGLEQSVVEHHRKGLKLWGTCAGAILLAREIEGEPQPLALIDVVMQRNAFGSQLDSFTAQALIPQLSPEPIPLTFIRAPKIVAAGPDVSVLLRLDDYIAAAENSDVLVTVFHPELTPSLAFHRYFARKCGFTTTSDSQEPVNGTAWNRKSWMGVAHSE